MESRPPAREHALEAQVRELGFDPRQLTRQEVRDLVEIYRRCPDELLTQVAR